MRMVLSFRSNSPTKKVTSETFKHVWFNEFTTKHVVSVSLSECLAMQIFLVEGFETSVSEISTATLIR